MRNFLVHFDPNEELKVECDASPYGVGAVLFHSVGNEHRAIGFRSRTLKKAERHYSQLELEALALIFGVSGFRVYLLVRQFTLVTDHPPLLGLLKPDRQTPPMAAARIQRWAMFMGGYQYKMQYVPGKELLTADSLSRLPAPTAAEPVSERDPPECVLSLEALDKGIAATHELQELTAKDKLLARVAEYILQGWPRNTSGMAPYLLPSFDRKIELSMAHGLIYWGNRFVIIRKA